jgi:hypothetical protein
MMAVRDRVFGVLSTPERLAAWAAGAIASALLAWVAAHAVDLAEIAWRHRRAAPRLLTELVDDIVERIF